MAEKTGWTLNEISHINLQALRILAKAWTKLYGGKSGKSVSSKSQIEDVLAMKSLTNNIK
jgi:hypothetical protein